jgi:hypothetical protein
MIGSETATLARIEPFYSWNTPICWTGFIVFADAVVWKARGRSWLRSSPREFAMLALASIGLWVVFEGFNLVIRNWHYTGLPDNTLARYAGYAWAFATIWPAIFEAAELIGVIRKAGWPGRADGVGRHDAAAPSFNGIVHSPAVPAVVGGAMLLSPFVVPAAIAAYLAAPVWLGFILLLDPLNAWLGGESIVGDWRAGRTDRLTNLLLAGLVCGVLWEFWNYWAGAKWHYTVPILPNVKIFEMPLLGYLGFPPFAVECFAMYVSLRLLYHRVAGHRTAELPHQIAL